MFQRPFWKYSGDWVCETSLREVSIGCWFSFAYKRLQHRQMTQTLVKWPSSGCFVEFFFQSLLKGNREIRSWYLIERVLLFSLNLFINFCPGRPFLSAINSASKGALTGIIRCVQFTYNIPILGCIIVNDRGAIQGNNNLFLFCYNVLTRYKADFFVTIKLFMHPTLVHRIIAFSHSYVHVTGWPRSYTPVK